MKQQYEQLKKSGYNILDINDDFYQDICIPFDSSEGTDMIISDRVNYINNNDNIKCQSNCKFSKYSLENLYLNCSCSSDFDNNEDYLEKKKNI